MDVDLAQEGQQAHAFLDQLPAAQLSAVRHLLESMINPVSVALANAPLDNEELTEEDAATIDRSRDLFKHNEGTLFEDVVVELGFTMDDLCDYKEPA